MNSCGDCEFFANQYRKDHFNIILDVPFKYLVSIGDTLVKKEGELRVFIHKRDTVLVYHFECDGKIYD